MQRSEAAIVPRLALHLKRLGNRCSSLVQPMSSREGKLLAGFSFERDLRAMAEINIEVRAKTENENANSRPNTPRLTRARGPSSRDCHAFLCFLLCPFSLPSLALSCTTVLRVGVMVRPATAAEATNVQGHFRPQQKDPVLDVRPAKGQGQPV